MKILTLPFLLLALMALSQAAGSPVAVAESETKEIPAEAANDQPETLPEGSPDENDKTENEETVSEVNSDLVKRSGYCPDGWYEHKRRCFRFMPKPMRWAQAEKNCVSMGANLASIHNIDEYHFVQDLIRRATHSLKEAWIGGADAEERGVWLWSDGSASHYTNWCRGEPSFGQHCLQMNYSNAKCWDNLGCHEYRPFVCAKRVWRFRGSHRGMVSAPQPQDVLRCLFPNSSYKP
ncbi:galactose-specific lectin nattectin-like isoform X1 [Fundulus heteroclitus]|uniref:galactose-specific lectin nattectin-like isoform X1 n=1 Tax=Fundulus heteroclitus TaxID=8078 RepID=UPI00079F105F|nr:galactose-specific lectin nattectin-like isoform X1 [Fundulus heteroclitus]